MQIKNIALNFGMMAFTMLFLKYPTHRQRPCLNTWTRPPNRFASSCRRGNTQVIIHTNTPDRVVRPRARRGDIRMVIFEKFRAHTDRISQDPKQMVRQEVMSHITLPSTHPLQSIEVRLVRRMQQNARSMTAMFRIRANETQSSMMELSRNEEIKTNVFPNTENPTRLVTQTPMAVRSKSVAGISAYLIRVASFSAVPFILQNGGRWRGLGKSNKEYNFHFVLALYQYTKYITGKLMCGLLTMTLYWTDNEHFDRTFRNL